MPAEWQHHEGTHLAWPANTSTWPGNRLDKIREYYLDIIGIIARHETVFLLVPDVETASYIKKTLRERGEKTEHVQFYIKPVNDCWIRDYGPIYVTDLKKEVSICSWEYNAWGEKYPPFDADNAIAPWYAHLWNLPLLQSSLTLEGGAVDVNGSGLMMTTESVLLNDNRNRGWNKKEIEKELTDKLGAEHIIWFKQGIAGDDTDGHVDDFARFVNKSAVVVSISERMNDPNFDILLANKKTIRQQATHLDIIDLPVPDVRTTQPTMDGSNVVPASYTNFYILNGAVLVPVFNDPADKHALEIMEFIFPDRRIYEIYSADLVWGQGGIHCITQQKPAV